jgi:hypothetical protein
MGERGKNGREKMRKKRWRGKKGREGGRKWKDGPKETGR